MHQTREEQETTIVFTAAEDMATVYTCDTVWLRKMERLKEKAPDVVTEIRRDECGATYRVPKRLVKLTAPRVMSDEQRAAAAERLRKARAQ